MTPEHLGGHYNVTHIDKNNLIYMQEKYMIKTMIDIGCGPGGMVDTALSLGIDCIGVDGDPSVINKNIIQHDFVSNKLNLEKKFDFAWSCEFVEHVEEKYQDNYMCLFQKCKYVIITFAPPGRKGYHHVNCQEENYWIKVFEKYNFVFSKEETDYIRNNSSMNLDRPKKQFVQRNGLFFINKEIR